jgi:integrase
MLTHSNPAQLWPSCSTDSSPSLTPAAEVWRAPEFDRILASPESPVARRTTGPPYREAGAAWPFICGENIFGIGFALRESRSTNPPRPHPKPSRARPKDNTDGHSKRATIIFKELRENRVRVLQEIIDEYLVCYRLRYRSATFAEYALGHVARLLGTKVVGDITDSSVLHYQEDRLREKAAPKSINEEVRFLLKILGDPGELIRAQLKKTKQLKLTVHKHIGKAFDSEESEKLTGKARKSRSPHMYPAFMLARNGALRDTEIKTLTRGQINFDNRTVKVGRAKSEAGEGRVVPLNIEVYQALVEQRAWYRKRFGEVRESGTSSPGAGLCLPIPRDTLPRSRRRGRPRARMRR